MTGVLIVITVAGVVLIPLALLLAQGRLERGRVEAELARRRTLSASEARRLALDRMRTGSEWTLRTANESNSVALPPAVADVLGEFDEIVCGEFWLGRAALSQSARIEGFVKIGGDFEFCELMVKPTGVEVYSSYADADPLEVSPTVWHKILEVSE